MQTTNLLDHTKKILKDLVSFNSVSHRSNLDIIQYIKNYLDQHNISSTIIYNDDQTKANLFASIGEAATPGVILSGHTDVVPVNAKEWSHPPFDLHEKDGRLFGRGSVDMKGFVACMLAQAPLLKSAPLAHPVHLCFSYDEEVGCLGVPSLIDHINTLALKPKLAIIGEPTDMRMVKFQKGKITVRCTIKGQTGHTSMAPLCNNTIELTARIIILIADLAKQSEQSGPFDTAYSISHNTALTTLINGGNGMNVIPEDSEFCFEIRFLPDQDIDAIFDSIKSTAKEMALEISPDKNNPPHINWEVLSYNQGLTDKTEQLADFCEIEKLLIDKNEKVSYGTEAPFFQEDGHITSIICGPGSIKQAHQPDEYIEISQLEQCLDFISQLHKNYLLESR